MRSVLFAAFILMGGNGYAQSPRSFEVASIKPASPDEDGMMMRFLPGGGLNIKNLTLKGMIAFAWRVESFQISGGPSWFDIARFDIVAKSEAPATPDETKDMLQVLLKDRFHLTMNQETKELPIYAIVLARKDGKLGPGLIEAKEGSCKPPDPSKFDRPAEPGELPVCNRMMVGAKQIGAVSVRVGDLTASLSRLLGRNVVDKTGLTGKYNIQMKWSPDETQAVQAAPATQPALAGDALGSSIFTAFQEQLGLKLEAQKGPVKVLIVESADNPSEN